LFVFYSAQINTDGDVVVCVIFFLAITFNFLFELNICYFLLESKKKH